MFVLRNIASANQALKDNQNGASLIELAVIVFLLAAVLTAVSVLVSDNLSKFSATQAEIARLMRISTKLASGFKEVNKSGLIGDFGGVAELSDRESRLSGFYDSLDFYPNDPRVSPHPDEGGQPRKLCLGIVRFRAPAQLEWDDECSSRRFGTCPLGSPAVIGELLDRITAYASFDARPGYNYGPQTESFLIAFYHNSDGASFDPRFIRIVKLPTGQIAVPIDETPTGGTPTPTPTLPPPTSSDSSESADSSISDPLPTPWSSSESSTPPTSSDSSDTSPGSSENSFASQNSS